MSTLGAALATMMPAANDAVATAPALELELELDPAFDPALDLDPAFAAAVDVALDPAFAAPGPSAAAGSAGKYPKGATHGCVAFADGTGCPIRESRPNLRTRSAQRGGRAGGVCFLLVTFLCTSKEK